MADELINPLFEDEREFLEHKKQEYERALRGDVEHIKEQGTQIGKVALVGAGLAGSVWLIRKIFGGKNPRQAKKEKERRAKGFRPDEEDYPGHRGLASRFDFADADDFELDDDAFGPDRSAEFGRDSRRNYVGDDHAGGRAARESAQVFAEYDNTNDIYFGDEDVTAARYGRSGSYDDRENDFDNGLDNGRTNGLGAHSHQADRPAHDADLPVGRLDFGPAVYEHRLGGSGTGAGSARAYDDSRRLPESADFADDFAEDGFDDNFGDDFGGLGGDSSFRVSRGSSASAHQPLMSAPTPAKLATSPGLGMASPAAGVPAAAQQQPTAPKAAATTAQPATKASPAAAPTAPTPKPAAFQAPKPAAQPSALPKQLGGMISSFLKSETGKAAAAQATAVAISYVTKLMNARSPKAATGRPAPGATAKNTDLAAQPVSPTAAGAGADSASFPPAASPLLSDAPTEHPAS